MNRKNIILIFICLLVFQFSTVIGAEKKVKVKYEAKWNSLTSMQTPKWLKDGKFGIYTHWGVYAVPAQGPNATWFTSKAYMDTIRERKIWNETYGQIEKFGYKDFIPKFTGEKFNADEWADLFEKAGARFAGPVAEHHDGFSMWDTKLSKYNSVNMGPKRDVVGELEKAIKKRNMKFVTAFNHAELWFYYPTWDKTLDCSNPEYSDLYGEIHEKNALPTKTFLDLWKAKIIEVVDKYDPDFVWFDFGLNLITDQYKKEMLAYYYNKAVERNKDVVVSYKWHNLPPGAGLLDLELGQENNMTYNDWISDTTTDDGKGWGYVEGQGFKTIDNLVDNLVDRVSKHGYLLLNVGPKPDGTIPEEVKTQLLGMGEWLKVNGEAIYGTDCWGVAAEGTTKLAAKGAHYNEQNNLRYKADDIRFTIKDNVLYATVLEWPGEKVLIKSLAHNDRAWAGLYPSEIASITMLGDGKELKWEMTKEGLVIEAPKSKPCDYAYVFKIVRKSPF